MIEIIKNLGRKRTECKMCKSVIEYDPVDLLFDTECGCISDYISYLNSYKNSRTLNDLFIFCPICHNKIYNKGDN